MKFIQNWPCAFAVLVALAWGLVNLLLLVLILTGISGLGATSVVEIPLRVEYNYMKRVPGSDEFVLLARTPQDELIAIPEREIPRFRDLAESEGFNDVPMDDLAYMPSPSQAAGDTAKATITVEHQDKPALWLDDRSMFLAWNDEHPAPLDLINGLPVPYYILGSPITPPPAGEGWAYWQHGDGGTYLYSGALGWAWCSVETLPSIFYFSDGQWHTP